MRIYFLCIQPIQRNVNRKGFKSRSKEKGLLACIHFYWLRLYPPTLQQLLLLWKSKKCFRSSLRGGEKNTKRKVTHQCQYCDTFFRYKHKCTKHIKRCSGRQGFIYCFQDDEIKSYENYIKHKIGFSFNGGGVPGNHYMIYIGIGGRIYVCNLVLYYVQ